MRRGYSNLPTQNGHRSQTRGADKNMDPHAPPQVTLGPAPGGSLQLRVGSGPSLADLPVVARAGRNGGVIHARLTAPAHGRYVLIWFNRLPATPGSTYQASVYDVKLEGTA
jgi:hypothetical protein